MLRAAIAKPQVAGVSRAGLRLYSSHAHEHGHEHEHDHEHDHHETPLAPAESIVNKNTLTALAIFGLVAAYSYADSTYRASNSTNSSLVSALAASSTISEIKENYKEYRARVAKQTAIQEMMMFPSEARTLNNYVPRDTELFGRVWASGTNTQSNTIQNWEKLAPRKERESPFY